MVRAGWARKPGLVRMTFHTNRGHAPPKSGEFSSRPPRSVRGGLELNSPLFGGACPRLVWKVILTRPGFRAQPARTIGHSQIERPMVRASCARKTRAARLNLHT